MTLTTTLNTPDLSHSPRETARFNMIEQQIRTWEVLDPAVLALLDAVPREQFVAEAQAGLAFADIELPIGHGQTMLSPKVEGRILQALALKKTDKVLVIGAGSGYLTALIACQAEKVVALEINADLAKHAEQRVLNQGIKNTRFHVADGVQGLMSDAPFDVIVFAGALELRPTNVEVQLNIGGRLFAVVGHAPIMQATLVTRVSEAGFKRDVLFETTLPYLSNAPQSEKFSF